MTADRKGSVALLVRGLHIDAQSVEGGVVHLTVRANEQHQGVSGAFASTLRTRSFAPLTLATPASTTAPCGWLRRWCSAQRCKTSCPTGLTRTSATFGPCTTPSAMPTTTLFSFTRVSNAITMAGPPPASASMALGKKVLMILKTGLP